MWTCTDCNWVLVMLRLIEVLFWSQYVHDVRLQEDRAQYHTKQILNSSVPLVGAPICRCIPKWAPCITSVWEEGRGADNRAVRHLWRRVASMRRRPDLPPFVEDWGQRGALLPSAAQNACYRLQKGSDLFTPGHGNESDKISSRCFEDCGLHREGCC